MNTHNRRTLVVLASLLAATVVAVASTLVASSVWWSSSSPGPEHSPTASSPTASTSFPSTSMAPTPSTTRPSPTDTASASTASASKEPTQVPVSEPKPVDVVTTFAGWNATSRAVEVGGYATVVERAGTCTLRLSHADQVVTRKQTASADATTVACGAFSVPGTALTAGEWQAVLTYTSSTSTGNATAVTVKVP